jgi:hypothetical protein
MLPQANTHLNGPPRNSCEVSGFVVPAIDLYRKLPYNHTHNRLLRATGERCGNNHEEARIASMNAAARLGWGTDRMVDALFVVSREESPWILHLPGC